MQFNAMEDRPVKSEYTAVYEKRGRWIVAYLEEIPGVNTQGKTLKEARANLREALKLVLDANRQLASRRRRAVRREPLVIEVPA
jgi:predicted RNase H-like HicB family nuclease